MLPVADFYDGLAAEYHLAYDDWPAAVRRHGELLARLLTKEGVARGHVLDCACGIGTQAIGLSLEGYSVQGSDISSGAIRRLTAEARQFNVEIPVCIADFRTLETQFSDTFDAVICCDNSLPHLLTDADIVQALRSMFDRLEPHGVLIIGLRDYDALVADPPAITTPRLIKTEGSTSTVFQYWEWADDRSRYTLHYFVQTWHAGSWTTTSVSTIYRALQRADLEALLRTVADVVWMWHEPADTGHHQPLVTVRRA